MTSPVADPGEVVTSKGLRALDLAFYAVLALVAVVVLLAVFPPVGNADLWFHLAAGDAILDQGGIPAEDPFAHTTAGRSLVVHGWLADILLAVIRAAAGMAGLRIFCGLILLLALAAYALLLARLGWSKPLALTIPIVILALFADRIRLRPDLFSFLGFPLFLLALSSWHEAKRSLCLPACLSLALVAVWVNLHPAVLFCPVLAGMLWLGHKVRTGGMSPDASEGLPLAAPFLLLAATLVNPYGPKLYLYALVLAGGAAQYVGEWSSSLAYFLEGPSRLGHALAPFAVAILVALGLRGSKRADANLSWAAVGLVALGYAFQNARFLYLLFVPVAALLPVRWRTPKRAALVGLSVSLVGGAGLLLTRGDVIHHVAFHPTDSVRQNQLPVDATTRLLREMPSPLKLWHLSGWGGYLADQSEGKARIFMDGRIVLYDEQVLKEAQYLEASPRAGLSPGQLAEFQAEKERILESRGVQGIVMRPGFWPRGGKWLRVYVSPVAEVFLHTERAKDHIGFTIEVYRRRGLDIRSEQNHRHAEDLIAEFLGIYNRPR